MTAECPAVARAEDLQVQGDVKVATAKLIDTMPSQFSSTAQDLARGEVLGVATPANRVLWALVKLMEGKRG